MFWMRYNTKYVAEYGAFMRNHEYWKLLKCKGRFDMLFVSDDNIGYHLHAAFPRWSNCPKKKIFKIKIKI